MSTRKALIVAIAGTLIGMACGLVLIGSVTLGANSWWLLVAGFCLGGGTVNLAYAPWPQLWR